MTDGASMPLHDRPIRKANPGTFQSDEEIIRQFVVRHTEFDIVREELSGNVDAPSCQHVLVVAPRGYGKTMLLARVAAELRAESDLGSRLVPVRFMEESHEVFDLADFWLECLFFLSRESSVRDELLQDELRATHAALAERPRGEELIESRARAAVLGAADRLEKKLVLMVENLQSLCGDVDDDFGWKLREALQMQPEIILLATATSRFAELDDATQPFFELFRIVSLAPLKSEECRLLWDVVSGESVDTKEIRPLRILTGGSPRLLVFIADFARHGSLVQLMEQLVRLVDDHTEYFRTYLDGLAKTERRVYLSTVDLWRPSTATEIAVRARLDIRVVSTMLGRLVRRGALIFEGTGRKRRYSAAERLYGIYYKLRRERDEAAFVSNLILFMAAFYRRTELENITERLIVDGAQSTAIRAGIRRAFWEASSRDAADPREVLFAARIYWADARNKAVKGNPEEAIMSLDAVIREFEASEAAELQLQVATALSDKASIHILQLDDWEAGGADLEEVVSRFGDSEAVQLQVRVSHALHFQGFMKSLLGEAQAATAFYDEVVRRYGASEEPLIQQQVVWALVGMGIEQRRRGDWQGGIATYREIIRRLQGSKCVLPQEVVAETLDSLATAQDRLDHSTAFATYDEVVRRYGASVDPALQKLVGSALISKGAMQERRGNPAAAISSYEEVCHRFGDVEHAEIRGLVASAMLSKAFAQYKVGSAQAAVVAYDEVVARFGASEAPELQASVAMALNNRAIVQREIGPAEDEIATYDELVKRYGDRDSPNVQQLVAVALVNKGIALGQLGNPDAEIVAYDELAGRYGTSESPKLQAQLSKALYNKGLAQIRLGRPADTLATCNELVRLSRIRPHPDAAAEWCASWLRTAALLQQGESDAALAAFRGGYRAIPLEGEHERRDLVRVVIGLISSGASEQSLLEILLSDRQKAAALVPLVVALRRRVGEQVRAPVEVIEVADDILDELDVTSPAAGAAAPDAGTRGGRPSVDLRPHVRQDVVGRTAAPAGRIVPLV